MGDIRIERIIRAIPIWLLREYLEHLGGQSGADGWLGDVGWAARLTQIEDYRIGSLRVGQVCLELQGDAVAVAHIQEQLEPKLLRAGG